MRYHLLSNCDLSEKRVLIRVDLNVPIQNGKIINDARIQAILPTLKLCLEANAKIMLLSHLGRPIEGQFDPNFSLAPIAVRLSQLIGQPVRLAKDWLEGVQVAPKEIVLCENVRFNFGEEANDEVLSKKMAALCDVFVMDAFATAHRAQASTVGVAKYAPMAVAGPLLVTELTALHAVMESPKRPLVAIVGGAKVSDKLQVLQSLVEKVNVLIVGGGIANTFIAALGHSVGSSLYERNLIPIAKELLQKASGTFSLMLPIDVVVARDITDTYSIRTTKIADIKSSEKILDVGPESSRQYEKMLARAGTILWNGPMGVFEKEAFQEGTKQLAENIAHSAAYSVAGGGETLAAIEKFNVADKISYISTGGGAFLEYLEGKTLPAIAALES